MEDELKLKLELNTMRDQFYDLLKNFEAYETRRQEWEGYMAAARPPRPDRQGNRYSSRHGRRQQRIPMKQTQEESCEPHNHLFIIKLIVI